MGKTNINASVQTIERKTIHANECVFSRNEQQKVYYESRGRTSDFRLQTSDFRLQTSDLRLSSSEFDWDVGFPASAILIAVIIKIDEGVCRKLS